MKLTTSIWGNLLNLPYLLKPSWEPGYFMTRCWYDLMRLFTTMWIRFMVSNQTIFTNHQKQCQWIESISDVYSHTSYLNPISCEGQRPVYTVGNRCTKIQNLKNDPASIKTLDLRVKNSFNLRVGNPISA